MRRERGGHTRGGCGAASLTPTAPEDAGTTPSPLKKPQKGGSRLPGPPPKTKRGGGGVEASVPPNFKPPRVGPGCGAATWGRAPPGPAVRGRVPGGLRGGGRPIGPPPGAGGPPAPALRPPPPPPPPWGRAGRWWGHYRGQYRGRHWERWGQRRWQRWGRWWGRRGRRGQWGRGQRWGQRWGRGRWWGRGGCGR